MIFYDFHFNHSHFDKFQKLGEIMFCLSDKKFRSAYNDTSFVEEWGKIWEIKYKYSYFSFFTFIVIFLFVTNSLWIRGLLKTNHNRCLSLPQRLNLFSGIIGLLHVALLTLDICLLFANVLLDSCWKSTIIGTFLFVFVLMQVNVVITSGVIRYIYLAFPLKPVSVKKVYAALVGANVFSFGLGSVFCIGDYMEMPNFERTLPLGVAGVITLNSALDVLLIVALQLAMSKVTIIDKEALKRHSIPVKRLTILNVLGIILSSPLSAVTCYYTFWVDLDDPENLLDMAVAVSWAYFVMTTYNGFVPSIHLFWNKKVRKIYGFKRSAVSCNDIIALS